MKKISSFLLLLLLAVSLFVSCNADEDHGMYYRLATSSEESDYSISGILNVNDQDNKVYFYSSEGIFLFNGSSITPIIESTDSTKVSYAYFKSDNEIYWMDRDGFIYKYDGSSSSKISGTKSYDHLWENGYVTDDVYGVCKADNLDTVISEKKVSHALIYGSSIAFADSENTYIYEDSTLKSTLSGTAFNGFTEANDTYYLVISGNIYKVSENNKTKETNWSYTLQDGNFVPAFASDTKIYLKFADSYVIYDINNNTSEEKTSLWASNTASSVVVCLTDSYIATSGNGFYTLDIDNNKSTRLF